MGYDPPYFASLWHLWIKFQIKLSCDKTTKDIQFYVCMYPMNNLNLRISKISFICFITYSRFCETQFYIYFSILNPQPTTYMYVYTYILVYLVDFMIFNGFGHIVCFYFFKLKCTYIIL